MLASSILHKEIRRRKSHDPGLQDDGCLPAGIHPATLDEIADRFGQEAELLAGLPFINMELVGPEAFRQFTERTFATDRNLVPKGMVEVVP
jgi:hypothetical protein